MELEDRIRKLEWWNRLLAVVILGFLVYGFSNRTLLARTGVEKVVRAERVEVVNSAGQPVVALGLDDHGSTGLFINDSAGEVRVALAHDAEGSALFIRDVDGVIRVGVAQFAHGGGGVALHGPNSQGAAVLYFKESGSLTFYNPDGEPTLRLPDQAGE